MKKMKIKFFWYSKLRLCRSVLYRLFPLKLKTDLSALDPVWMICPDHDAANTVLYSTDVTYFSLTDSEK